MSSILQGPIAGTSGLLAAVRRGASLGAMLRGPRLGPELVTNGAFSSGTTGWNPNGSPSTFETINHAGRTSALHLVVPATAHGAMQPDVFEPGLTYQVEFDVKVISGSVYLGISNNKVGGSSRDVANSGSWTRVRVNDYVATDASLRIYSTLDAGEFYLDNISVREVLPQYGPELVTNGGFDDATGWSSGSAWTIGGGILTATDVPAYNIIGQPFSTSAGRKYEVTYDVVEFTSGSVRASLTGGSTVVGTSRNAVGSYREVITTSDAHTALNIGSAGAGFTGKIDNVSVREIL